MTNHTIYGTFFQTASTVYVPCAICRLRVPMGSAMSGPTDAFGQLAFVCELHLRDIRQLINRLADYRIAKQQHSARPAKTKGEPLDA